jgi:hypothetical protein
MGRKISAQKQQQQSETDCDLSPSQTATSYGDHAIMHDQRVVLLPKESIVDEPHEVAQTS